MSQLFTLAAPCLFGLESVLNFELRQIGATNLEGTDGRITFEGDQSVLARANLWLRTAERVYIVLGTFKATTFTELFDNVEALPFEDYIGENDAFPVKGWTLDSQLESVPSCQSIIKKAIVERLKTTYPRELFPETGPEHQVAFSIHKDEVTMMLDTTGLTLHKRGYRRKANVAPLRETLSAGICDFARIREDDQVYDPMCGSGTLLIEAALRAMNIAPGIKRLFSFEDWHISDPRIWQQERAKALDAVRHDVKFHGYGSDIDRATLRVAKENARMAGVEDRITFSYGDVADFQPESPSIVVTNPPYGERMLEEEDALKLFERMGKAMPPRKGVNYYVIAPPHTFEPAFGRPADRRRKLYNGMIPSQLYMYFR